MAATVYKGSCTCEAIKIEVLEDPAFVSLCHCLNCQKSTSSTYSTNWVIPKTAFKLISGEPTTYELIGGSGNPAYRKFCNICSTLLWTESAVRSDLIIIKAGVMNDCLGKFTPGSEFFTARKPGWVKPVEHAGQFEGSFPFQSEKIGKFG